jgi:prepilin-type N-terminal cleavage/methylation domain-containing protein
MYNENHMNSHRGFTLIELLVVIAIIGLLAAIVLASLNEARIRGRDGRRAADMHQAITTIELYASDHGGVYPPVPSVPNIHCGGNNNRCLDDLDGTGTNASLLPYIGAVPADPIFNNKTQNYLYCITGAAACEAGAGRCYTLLRWTEQGGGWCIPRELPSPPTGTSCWFTNGNPTISPGFVGYCD